MGMGTSRSGWRAPGLAAFVLLIAVGAGPSDVAGLRSLARPAASSSGRRALQEQPCLCKRFTAAGSTTDIDLLDFFCFLQSEARTALPVHTWVPAVGQTR